ncbi:RND family transporter, partial [Flavobacterium sp. LBUM151]
MKNTIQVGFWEKLARIILKNRITILIVVALLTIFLGFQWKNLAMTYTEANLLPKEHKANKDYQKFLDKFGEEGNLIVIGFKDPNFFTPKNYAAWNELMTGLKKAKEVDLVVSLNDLKKLEKDTINEKFILSPFIDQSKTLDPAYLKSVQHDLFNNLPFYEG